MIYVVILYFFLKLPGNVLGAAYNQVRLIVQNLRYVYYPFLALSTLKRSVILVYPFQEKNVYYTSWELNLEKRVSPIKIFGAFPWIFLGILTEMFLRLPEP